MIETESVEEYCALALAKSNAGFDLPFKSVQGAPRSAFFVPVIYGGLDVRALRSAVLLAVGQPSSSSATIVIDLAGGGPTQTKRTSTMAQDQADLHELTDQLFALTHQTEALLLALVGDEETLDTLTNKTLCNCLWLAHEQLGRVRGKLTELSNAIVMAEED